MFTGLIQGVGRVAQCANGSLAVEANGIWSDDPIVLGESIAVNGCCLTVVEDSKGILRFDLSPETLSRTTLGSLLTNEKVNLERAMKLGDRLGGHMVQGHIDCTCRVTKVQPQEQGVLIGFEAPIEYSVYLVDKGSICVDGISLTVVQPIEGTFHCAIIPFTLEATNLDSRKAGDSVNLEFDILAKTIRKLAEPYQS